MIQHGNCKKTATRSYRVRIFDHYETNTDGERKAIYQSFTAPTKREAERAAAIWAANKTTQRPENITVTAAIDKYITAKKPSCLLAPLMDTGRCSAMTTKTLKLTISGS